MRTPAWLSRDSAFSSSHHHRLLDLLSMVLWFMRFRTFVRIVLTLLSVVGPLLGFHMTYIMLHDWIQIRQGDVYYVEHDCRGSVYLTWELTDRAIEKGKGGILIDLVVANVSRCGRINTSSERALHIALLVPMPV